MAATDPKKLASARALLKRGNLDGAVRQFVEAEAHDEAAKALAAARRFVEGAEVLLKSLGVPANALARLRDPHLRARARQAAALLRQAGLRDAADEVEDQVEGTNQRFGPGVEDEKTVRASELAGFSEEKTQIAMGRPTFEPRTQPFADASHLPDHGPGLPRTPVRGGLPGPERRPPGWMALATSANAPVAPPVVPRADEQTQPPRSAPAPRTRTSSSTALRPGTGPFEPGALIAERYQLGPQIGRGGMARVFRAKDVELGQDIAIKVFDRMDDATLLARFKQELLSSRQIAHPNVVRLFDIGTHAEQKYLTMELLVGQDLKERLTQPIAVSESLDLLIQACRGLEAAHAVGVIHRDVKPQNLFITSQRVVKVMDFGIAKLEAAAKLTSPGMGVGTPEYMAPEQILDSSKVSAATDLYSIGVTAYRMCTGRVPFHDKDLLKLFKKQLKEDPPPPRQLNPRLPAQLEVILLKLLQKDPAARYRRAAEVAEAFTAVRKLFPGSPS